MLKSRAEKLLAPYLASNVVRPNGDMDMHCPFHEDVRRSATVNFKTQQWFCFACERGGGIQVLIKERSKWLKPSEGGQARSAGSKRHIRNEPLPDPARIDGWHSALISSSDHLEWFEVKRGLTQESLQRHNIGWDGGRYTIPVYDEEGTLVNIRRYAPQGDPKMLHWPGFGSPARLFPMSILLDERKQIVICEGELDAILGNQHGIPTITTTSGVKARWRDEWNSWFSGLKVYICLDRDKEGRRATRRIHDALVGVASDVCVIDLPYPFGSKKDLTDYFLDGGTPRKLFKLVKPRSPKPGQAKAEPDAEYAQVEYEALRQGSAEGRKVEIHGTLSSMFSTQILLPDALEAKCNFDWDPKKCEVCPCGQHGGDLKVPVPDGADLQLELFTTATIEGRNKLFRKQMGIPERCPRVVITPKMHSAWDCEIRNGSNLAEEAFPVVLRHEGKPPVLNRPYIFKGRMRTSPRGQRAVFMASSIIPAMQDLDTFDPTAEEIALARDWTNNLDETPDLALEQIAEQLEYHVTEIYGQRLLHIGVDLVYHSILKFPFGGSNISRGWMECLAVGDTRSGKSTAIQKILELYGRGHYQSAENASVAGLLFGVDRRLGMGRETWGGSVGVLPLNNRGLVAIDEAQGLRTEQIAQMSDMRSRGIVQVSKIRSAEVEAAVRLIWLGNGRRQSYSRGIDALRDQMGQAEDLARVDIPLYIKGDIGRELDKKQQTYGPLEWPSSILQWVVLWAWSRKPDDIEWTRDGMASIWTDSKELSARYSTSIPIFQPNEAGVRLARMAVAVAARLFSSPDGRKLVIDEEHVHAARRLYERFLGAKELGIESIKKRETDVAKSEGDHGIEFREFLKTTPPMIRQMLSSGDIGPNGFGSVDPGGNLCSKLSGWNVMVFENGRYTVSNWAADIARDMS